MSSEDSPWAPRPPDSPAPTESREPAGPSAPADPPEGTDLATALGIAVALLALAGVCALLGQHFLLGVLRLTAGVLAGAGLGLGLLAVLGPRLAPRARRLLAGALAVAVALALTVPAVLTTRLPAFEDLAAASIDALGEGDTVHSLPDRGAPVLVRRADGDAQILDDQGARTLDADPEDVLALSADGSRLLQATGATTIVHLLDRSATAPADHPFPAVTVDGSPLALSEDLLVVQRCEEGSCHLGGVDLADPTEDLWTLSAAAEDRGPDPAGLAVPARPEQPPTLLEGLRTTGVLPTVPLRFDPAQGWFQIDPATGFPVGRLLAGAEQECRLAGTSAPQQLQDPLLEEPLVLTACSGEDGALTASAYRDGELLWQSAPSPPGEWTVRLDQGRVIAAGTQEGSGTSGELVASEQSEDWVAPGGEGITQATAFTSRIGIDGARMILTNEAGQLVAYDTADGSALWTQPLTGPAEDVRGELVAGSATVLEPIQRERPLDPRGAKRLRVLDAATGQVSVSAASSQEIGEVRAVGGGRALVTVDGQSLLLGP